MPHATPSGGPTAQIGPICGSACSGIVSDLRLGPLALKVRTQRCGKCSNVLRSAHQPASSSAHRQHRAGDGKVQPDRPRIARCGSGDDGEAGDRRDHGMAAPDRESCCPIERGWPVDANHGLPLRPPQHSSAAHSKASTRPDSATVNAVNRRPTGSPGNLRLDRAWKPHVHPGWGRGERFGRPGTGSRACVSRIAGGTARQRDDRSPLCRASWWATPPTARYGRSQVLAESPGTPGQAPVPAMKSAYQAISRCTSATSFSPVAEPEGNPYPQTPHRDSGPGPPAPRYSASRSDTAPTPWIRARSNRRSQM